MAGVKRIDIAVVGAGFSGSLLALQILRTDIDARVHLIEQSNTFGRGLAYGAADPGHLLNVRAANMSAFPDAPGHFTDWLRSSAPEGGEAPAFVSRQLFGAYLQALLVGVVQSGRGAGRLVAVADEAVGANFDGERPRLRLALGREIEVDYVVLATGNLPPHDPPCFVGADPSRYISDPWRSGSFAEWGADDAVLLLGTGLTAVDMVLRLRSLGHAGPVKALSRRGLRPHRHVNFAPAMAPLPVPSRPALSALVRHVRIQAAERGWHDAIDGLRPHIQRLWCEAGLAERRRFLRHLRPWWDVHRHRIAPSVADTIDEATRRGDLAFLAGRIQDVDFEKGGFAVAWQPRGVRATSTMRVQRVVNCTGPAGDLGKAQSPLLQDVLRRGLARRDACGLGIEVDPDCHVVDADGRPEPRLLAIGPMSRGAFWEITAVPDIRVQAARLAGHLGRLGAARNV